MPDNLIYAGSRHRIRRWRNYGITSSPPIAPVEFLFHDDFLTDEAAPLTSPRTTEPGPGIATIVDTGNVLDISGGQIVPNATTIGNGDPAYLENNGLARIAGLAAYFNIRNYSGLGGTGNTIHFGWADDNTPAFTDMNGFLFDATNIKAKEGGIGLGVIGTFTNDVLIGLFCILRTAGFFLVDGDTDTLLYVTDGEVQDPVYAGATTSVAGRAPFGLDTLRVSQLPSPWDTDYGIATDRLAGVRGFGDAFVHEAGFIGEFIQTTVPTAGFTSFQFRRQSVNNYWSVVVEPSTDLSLFEVVAGVPTLRGIALGVVGNGDRIVVIADGTTIRVYEQNTLRITYALAANFQTETDGSLLALGVGGAVSDIVTFPRVLSGAALRALDRVADA